MIETKTVWVHGPFRSLSKDCSFSTEEGQDFDRLGPNGVGV